MTAALAVIFSHSWPLTQGPGAIQPLETLVGFQLGTLAVFVFFAISGFLVTRSYERQPSAWAWVRARGLRIYPGLAVVLVVTAMVLGPLATTLPLGVYFGEPATYGYVLHGLSLGDRQSWLPGVFHGNSYALEPNGSLWTLYHEVLCYMALLCAASLGALRSRWAPALLLLAVHVALVVASLTGAPWPLLALLRFMLPFGWGVAFYVYRDRLPLTPWLLIPLVGLVVAAQGTSSATLQHMALMPALAYGTFLLAYLPKGAIRQYNSVGDYSYGVYIYGWPVQQMVVHALGPTSPITNFAVSAPIVLVLAWLSWNHVEKPALALLRRPGQARHSA